MNRTTILDCNLYGLAGRIFDAYPEALPVGDFGSYRILKPLGRGGMGEVYLAQDVTAGRHVAIKFLRQVWSEPDSVERFTREIKMLATLEHPFIGRLYDHGVRTDGTPWFANGVCGRQADRSVRPRTGMVVG